jgi:hypothetical protein
MRDVRSSSIVPEGASPRRHAAEQLRVGTRAAVLGRGPNRGFRRSLPAVRGSLTEAVGTTTYGHTTPAEDEAGAQAGCCADTPSAVQ